MSLRHLVLAGLMSCLATPLVAEGLRPPAELPPAGFKGEQYVDSTGCVFLRAGVGERVTWVARISRERRQMCGLAPSLAPAAAAPAPEVVAVAAPAPDAAPAPVHRTTPKVTRAAAAPAVEVPLAHVVCPAHAPVARRLSLKGGGTKVLCIPEGVEIETLILPKGYREAWADDRLNPLRGIGTAEGEAMQERVWTRKVPARLVAEATVLTGVTAAPVTRAPARPAGKSVRKAFATTLSTSTAPVEATGRYLVQVGSFGVPANAERTRERLVALGLPVTGGKGTIKGQPVQVVYAGPFPGAEAAQAALRAVRGAGFGDAFLR